MKHNIGQLLFLMLCFAMLNTLFIFIFQIGAKLLTDRPEFVGTQAHLVTIGRKSQAGSFVPIRGYDLEQIASLPFIEDVARVSFDTTSIYVNNTAILSQTVTYYSDNLANLLSLPETINNPKKVGSDSVFISHEFAHQHLNTLTLSDVTIQLKVNGKKYQVAGVLPKSMNDFGQLSPSVWLKHSELSDTLPFRLSKKEQKNRIENEKNQKLTLSLLRGMPHYFGIAKLSYRVSLDEFNEQLAELQSQIPSVDVMSYHEAPHQNWLINGMEFSPESKQALVKIWTVLLLLSLFFLLLCSISLFSLSTNQIISRRQEFIVRIAVGATFSKLILQLLREQLPLVIAVSVTGSLCYMMSMHYLAQSSHSALLLEKLGGEVDWLSWIVGNLLIAIFIFACSILPISSLFKRQFFVRSSNLTNTKQQQYLSHVIEVIQKSIAIFALSLVAIIIHQQYIYYSKLEINTGLKEITFLTHNPMNINEDWLNGNIDVFQDKGVALSGAPFVSPSTQSIDVKLIDENLVSKVAARKIDISSNYFIALGGELIAGSKRIEKHGVVINRTVAEQLVPNKEQISSLLGRKISIKSAMKNTTLTITGIIEDLPHFGVNNTGVPFIYQHLTQASNFLNRIVTFYYPEFIEDEFLLFVESWADKELALKETIFRNNLEIQLRDFNAVEFMLFDIALLLALCILIVVYLNIYYQQKSFLALNKVKIGTMFALGAMPSRVFWEIIKTKYFHILAATPLALIIIALTMPVLAESLEISKFSFSLFSLSVALLILVVGLLTYIPIMRLTKVPIKSQLI